MMWCSGAFLDCLFHSKHLKYTQVGERGGGPRSPHWAHPTNRCGLPTHTPAAPGPRRERGPLRKQPLPISIRLGGGEGALGGCADMGVGVAGVDTCTQHRQHEGRGVDLEAGPAANHPRAIFQKFGAPRKEKHNNFKYSLVLRPHCLGANTIFRRESRSD